jgi:hypothetical protein
MTARGTADVDAALYGGLDAATWDELAANRFYSSSGWLRMCAATPHPRIRGLVAETADGARGAVPVADVEAPLSGNYDWNRPLADLDLPRLPATGLLVGPTLAYHTHLLPDSRDPRIVSALLNSARNAASAGSDAGACVAMYLSTQDTAALVEAGVQAPPVLIEPEVWFEVPVGGWDAWLGTLSRTRRYRVLRDVREFESCGYRVWEEPLAACYERIVPLAVELARKLGANADPARFTKEFLHYVEATGEAAQVVLCEHRDGTLLSFCMYYRWGETIYLRWSASNYPRLAPGGAEYFNLCYYRQVELAGQTGARSLHAGKKAIEAKVLRGGLLRPLWMLDLREHSPLSEHSEAVRAHNARLTRELASNPVTAKAFADPAEWDRF